MWKKHLPYLRRERGREAGIANLVGCVDIKLNLINTNNTACKTRLLLALFRIDNSYKLLTETTNMDCQTPLPFRV